MSLTSCYRYILEIPTATLTSILQAALSESDAAGINISQTWENVSIGMYTATVTASPDDFTTHPSTMELTAVDLEVIVHLQMRLEVEINELPELDKIIYHLNFELHGLFFKNADVPPKLLIHFPSVTAASLNLTVTGGAITLTPALIEPRIHALYDADPSLGHNVQFNVPWPPGPDPNVMITTDIFDDTPGDPGFRGAITVSVPDQTHVVIHMPGHFKIQGLDPSDPYVNTDMTIDITVTVEHLDGILRVKLSTITAASVDITFVNTTIYDIGTKPILKNQIAAKLSAMGDQEQTFPNNAEVSAMIQDRVIEFANGLEIPIFTPQPPADPAQIDLTNFVPTTIEAKVLALQLTPLEDGTVCDMPIVFSEETGFALAISAVEANKIIKPIVDNNIGDHHISGYDMTVNSLSAVLHDPDGHDGAKGHIWIDGEVEVHVDCWFDPTIAFWGPIYLNPIKNPDQTVAFTADAGSFGADDPCCADVDPAQIADLIEGTQSTTFALPSNFSGVGTLQIEITSAEIFAAGIIVHGTFDVMTNLETHTNSLEKTLYWFSDRAGGA
jgi:hypothetical protein